MGSFTCQQLGLVMQVDWRLVLFDNAGIVIVSILFYDQGCERPRNGMRTGVDVVLVSLTSRYNLEDVCGNFVWVARDFALRLIRDQHL